MRPTKAVMTAMQRSHQIQLLTLPLKNVYGMHVYTLLAYLATLSGYYFCSVFTLLAAGHGTVQHAYIFLCKQISL